MSMKILRFELENVKRVALVRMAPAENGLTIIGGKNAAGKTSVLDGIVYALGGERYRPGNLQRVDGIAPARIRIELSGGLIVERKGKNASLKVTDATGRKRGQALLDSFLEELALNLPKFLAMKDSEKAEVLLQTLGIGEQLEALDLREKQAYDKRHDFGVIVDQKKKFAAELNEFPDVPETPLSAADLIAESQAILARNAKREEKRETRASWVRYRDEAIREIERLEATLAGARNRVERAKLELERIDADPVSPNESTAELEAKIASIEEINAKVRANLDKANAIAEAEEFERQLQPLTDALEAIRKERRDLLRNAPMPLPDLAIGKNEKGFPVLLYRNQPWDCMSTMEQYRVAAAIVRKLKPECGFLLLDGLETFDHEQLEAFDEWLRNENLQAICTKVGTEDCSIVIEDGVAVEEGVPPTRLPNPNDPIQNESNENCNQEMEW